MAGAYLLWDVESESQPRVKRVQELTPAHVQTVAINLDDVNQLDSQPDESLQRFNQNIRELSDTTVHLSASLEPILGGSSLSVPERLNMLEALDDVSLEELYAFLGSTENHTGLSDSNLYWLKNDIMTYARRVSGADEQYVDVLAAMYENQEMSHVMRDYALQHLSVVAMEREAHRDTVSTILEGATHDKTLTIAGSALLGLQRISDEQSVAGAETSLPAVIKARALAIVSDPEFSPEGKTSAIHLLNQYAPEAAKQYATKLLNDSSSTRVLKLACQNILNRTPSRAGNSPFPETAQN